MNPATKAKKDHPRVSGENLATARALVTEHGSSPRERGKPSDGALSQSLIGIIPA